MKIDSKTGDPPQLLTKLAVVNKEKKKQKKKGLEPRITLRVISRLNPGYNNCSFIYYFC